MQSKPAPSQDDESTASPSERTSADSTQFESEQLSDGSSSNSATGKSSKFKFLAVVLLALVLLGGGGVAAYMSLSQQKSTAPNQPKTTDINAKRANTLPEPLKNAIQKDLGITPKEYIKESDNTAGAAQVIERLTAKVPDSFVGSYIDKDGIVVINVTNEEGVKLVEQYAQQPPVSASTGAVVATAKPHVRARIVELSAQRLQSIITQVRAWINTLTKDQQGSLLGLAIDQPANCVIVNFADVAGAKGITLPGTFNGCVPQLKLNPVATPNPVTIFPTVTTPILGQSTLLAGDGYGAKVGNGTLLCSVGFSVTTATNKTAALTAGNCMEGIVVATIIPAPISLFAENGRTGRLTTNSIGDFVTDVGGNDETGNFHVVTISDKFADKFKTAGVRGDKTELPVGGSITPVQGAAVCKSGRSSGWTCGRITSTNSQTVFHTATNSISSTTQLTSGITIDACAQPGDDGGPIMSGYNAVGITGRVLNQTSCSTAKTPGYGTTGIGVTNILKQLPGYKLNTNPASAL